MTLKEFTKNLISILESKTIEDLDIKPHKIDSENNLIIIGSNSTPYLNPETFFPQQDCFEIRGPEIKGVLRLIFDEDSDKIKILSVDYIENNTLLKFKREKFFDNSNILNQTMDDINLSF